MWCTTQSLMKNVKLNLGYSQMFASDSMSLIKAEGQATIPIIGAGVQLIINPNLFTTNLTKNAN